MYNNRGADPKVFFQISSVLQSSRAIPAPIRRASPAWVVTAGLVALGLYSSAGCSQPDAEQVVDHPDRPQFASPWDKPIERFQGPRTDPNSPVPGAALAETLTRAGIATPMLQGSARVGAGEGTSRTIKQMGLADTSGSTSWSIALATFRADTEAGAANSALARVRMMPGMSEAYLDDRGRTLVVAYGRYEAPGSTAAKRDLARIQQLKVGGERPFSRAVLSPPSSGSRVGDAAGLELRNARRSDGDGEVLYTLQIGVYWRPDGQEPTAAEQAEFRAAAEKAAADLRREGIEAYYYHGPRKSMVTVGSFTAKEYDPSPQQINPMSPPKQSSELLQLREKFPYNLENGRAIKRTLAGASEGRIDPSFVVVIPP